MKPIVIILGSLALIFALTTAFLAGKLSNNALPPAVTSLSPEQKAKQTVAEVKALQSELETEASKERSKALRDKTLEHGKMIGLGLMMYAQDYDEKLPLSSAAQETLLPYIKNSEVFESVGGSLGSGPAVEWHTDGKALKDIPKPSDTIIAFKTVEGGRVNIYADGHAKWKADGLD